MCRSLPREKNVLSRCDRDRATDEIMQDWVVAVSSVHLHDEVAVLAVIDIRDLRAHRDGIGPPALMVTFKRIDYLVTAT